MRIGFLGPHATFTEQALLTLPESRGAELVPLPGAPAVLAAVRDGSVDAGCVPIEKRLNAPERGAARREIDTRKQWHCALIRHIEKYNHMIRSHNETHSG